MDCQSIIVYLLLKNKAFKKIAYKILIMPLDLATIQNKILVFSTSLQILKIQ